MNLKVRGTRQLFTAPKGEKGDKGEDGNSFTPKGQAYGHFDSSDEFYAALDGGQTEYGRKYLVDGSDEGTAMVYSVAIRRIGINSANDGDAYTIVNTKHLWAAVGNKWVDFGEIQGPKGDDGDDGKDAELYKLQLSEGWARWEKNGTTGWRLKCCIKGNAWFIKGGTKKSATLGTGYEEQRIRIRYNNNKQLHFEPIAGDGSWTDDGEGKFLEDDEYGSSNVGQPKCIIVELIGKDISDLTQVLDSQSIAIAWDGEPGKTVKGDPGPMGLPAGVYSSIARYERTNEIVPIVEHNGEYWYPRNEGVLTNSEPSANNNDWKKAENFEVMFVKILFAAFAKMGEAIFHGRYMFSQHGKVNGEASNNYELFSPEDPDNEGNASRFAPNLYLNFLTGAARLAAGKVKFFADGRGSLAGGNIAWDEEGNTAVRGTVYATGGEFSGYIKTYFKKIAESDANLIGTDESVWGGSRYTYELNTDFNLICEGFIVQLPLTTSLIGTRAAFFGGVGTRMDPWTIRLRCSRGILGYPSVGENTGSNNTITEITAAGGLIEMVCVGYNESASWCITSINVEYKYTNLDY